MQDEPLDPSYLADRLAQVPLLLGLSDERLALLAERGTRRDIARGDVLVSEGDAAETLFFVLDGRLTVQVAGTPIAEVAAGEPVGEIAFFAGGTRTATVTASRASTVLALDRETWRALASDAPELSEAIIRALAARVVAGNPARPHLEPRGPGVVAVLPMPGTQLPDAFAAALGAAIGGQAQMLWPEQGEDAAAARARIAAAEARGGPVVLFLSDAEVHPVWARAVMEGADVIALVVPPGLPPRGPTGDEARILSGVLQPNLHLVLLRETAATPIAGTADWLAKRAVGQHHHVALDRREDAARLSRFLLGRATGLVFCGGAAYGTAHLGMLKALNEAGYAFDMVGGASMGASMAGGYAMGLAPDAVMDMIDTLFLQGKALSRYTAPIWSVVDHRHLDRELARLTGEREIEDLPLPYFAVATSLTHNDLAVLRSGPLWRAMRASAAIPALLPPMVQPDGEVLIDGGLMDNAPLGPMRDLKAGPNVVMNIARGTDWRVMTPYEALPGRAGALRRMLLPIGRGVRFPRIFSILSRTMVVNSERLMAQVDPRDDVILAVPPLPKMSFLDWKQGRALFQRSYEVMAAALADEPAPQRTHGAGGPDDRLRAAAATLARQIDEAARAAR